MIIEHIRRGQSRFIPGLAIILGLYGCAPDETSTDPDILDPLVSAASGSPACERPRAGGGQDSLRLTELRFDCRIEAFPSGVTFSATLSDAFPSPGRNAVRLRGGRYVTDVGHASEHRLLLWDSTGAFITSYQQTGEGPGELPDNLGIYYLLADPRGDTLYVVDGRNTWSVFTPDLEFVRSFQIPTVRASEGLAVTDNGLILSTAPVTSDFRVQVFGLDGSLIREIKPADPAARPDPYTTEAIAYAGNGLFWITSPPGSAGDLVLEEWSTDGTLKRTIRRTTPGVSPSGFKLIIGPEVSDARMFPNYPLLSVDADGLLWIVGVVPDWTLREKTEHTFDRQSGEAPPLDIRLEVLDPDAGRVLASALIEAEGEPFQGILPGTGTIYSSVADSVGLMTLDFRDLRLVRK